MEFSFPIRVYYEDTDVAGVVYYANYLKFMERGRTEWLRHWGLDQSVLIDQDIAFAVRRAQVDYYRPARFNDALEVVSTIKEIRGVRVLFHQKIVSANDRELVYAEGEILVVCVTLSTMRPRPMPEELLEEMSRDA
ncbi:tol-pal system-associated acyl-CoA thioesterase [Pleionea litopenaei]|uniref:Tol-pal system-associated acyl-CoA thioesterase n=1 Tax=Pleionea litopenaei TaxID=3070815 RepID=A0AA51X8E0_9GAMM|nr:tol-pal system-associated acyl-CoA thioesterase [Pleionea sp. HL-JVS1]WMS88871.1 tol-pal system-associated acyl-CoA thioesterase [Pleionea sp. HL-JVS1]